MNEMQKGRGEQVWEKEVTGPIFNISYLHVHMYNFMTHVGCYELNVSPRNSYVEALPLNMMVLGGGAFQR